jgi:16S rRNA processing protein RimM
MAIVDYGALESEDGTRSFEIEALRPAKDFLVARFAGVPDRTTAEQLRNLDLYVARDRLPTPQADEFYHADLVGLAVVDASGATLGTVSAVHNFGAGDLVEVRPVHGGMTVMLPFTDAVVPLVDVAGGRIVVDPPEGAFANDATSEKD